jgi:hypothetical protein
MFDKHRLRSLLLSIGVATCITTLPALAQSRTTTWRCYVINRDNIPSLMGRVSIWWGHTPQDAQWACNNWISACGNSGGCYATSSRLSAQ